MKKSPWYPLDRRLGGSQSQSEWYGEGEHFLPYCYSNYDPSDVQPIASHNQLHYHSSWGFIIETKPRKPWRAQGTHKMFWTMASPLSLPSLVLSACTASATLRGHTIFSINSLEAEDKYVLLLSKVAFPSFRSLCSWLRRLEKTVLYIPMFLPKRAPAS
jgi:hypothetical protein